MAARSYQSRRSLAARCPSGLTPVSAPVAPSGARESPATYTGHGNRPATAHSVRIFFASSHTRPAVSTHASLVRVAGDGYDGPPGDPFGITCARAPSMSYSATIDASIDEL